MSVTNRQAFPVRVRLTSVGLKTQQLLEYYFRNSGATWYRQVDEQDQADCIAIDLDYPGSIEVIEEYCGLPETLCLVFSFAAYPGKNVINILKPLSLESLDAAAINIAQRLQRFQLSQAATTPAQLNTEKPADATTIDVAQPPLTTPNSAQHDSRLDLADSLLDEQVPEFPASKNPVHGMGKLHTRTHAENLSAAGDGLYSIFQEQHYLSGYLAKALESVDAQRVAFSISLPECNICVLPNEDRVYTSKSLKNAVTIQQIYSELNPGLIKVRYLSKYNRSVVAREIKSTKGFVYALEAFIWRSALLSANGAHSTRC